MLKIKITLNGEEREITPTEARQLLAELQEVFGAEEPAAAHYPWPSPPTIPSTHPWPWQPLPHWSPGITWTSTRCA